MAHWRNAGHAGITRAGRGHVEAQTGTQRSGLPGTTPASGAARCRSRQRGRATLPKRSVTFRNHRLAAGWLGQRMVLMGRLGHRRRRVGACSGLAARCGTFGWVQVTVRTYEPRDAACAADVFYRSVREVARSDYTDDQVKAWVPGPLNVEQEHLRSSDGRLVLVAADEQDRVVAFIDLEPDGHIDRLYCAPEAAGQGIASRLYDGLEAAAREQGIGRLFTEASELARRFFERKGFAVLERQDKILRSVPIHNYRMAKTLG